MNRRINQLGCIVLFLYLTMLFIPNIQANPSLYISTYSVNPEILHPGDTALLRIIISNGETSSTNTDTDYINNLPVDQSIETIGAVIENVYIISDGDGNHVVKAFENYKNPVEIAPASSITLDFTIKAEQNISNGIYTPLVHIDLESDSFQDVTFPISIKVSDDTIDLVPQNMPSQLSTIGETDLSLLLINNRQNDITNVMITPENSNCTDFSPSKQFISTLSGLGTETINFSLIPKITGSHLLTLNCTYKNGDNFHHQFFSVPLNISTFYEVYPIIYSTPETIQSDETKEIRLKIYNAKNEEISGVRIKPITEAKITPNEYFIGSMDADDLYAVTFDIETGNLSVNQTYPISYEITFKQANNIYTHIPITSSISVKAAPETNEIEYIFAGVVFIAIIGIILFILYLRKKRVSA